MSLRGWEALTWDQRYILEAHYRMIISDVSLFEDIGGGSTRCMLAEDWSRGDMITEII